MIPAYSPQARGRSERSFGTWQGRLPQELRLAGINRLEEANTFLREQYVAAFNEKFAVEAAEKGTAFRRTARRDLSWIFTVQTERVVANDNTVTIGDRSWQLEKSRFRSSLAGCTVTIHEHLDGTGVGPVWPARGRPLHLHRRAAPGRRQQKPGEPWKRRDDGHRGKPQTGFPPSPPSLGNPATAAGFPLFHRSGEFPYIKNQNPKTPVGKPTRGRGLDGLKRTDRV